MQLQRSTVLIAVCAALGGIAATGHANPQASPATPAAEENLFEVMVTARRREESLQEVPVAVTALSSDMLEATGAIDLTAVSQVVPNVTLENSRATNNTLTAFIRGVGQQDPIAGFEQGVGIYLDDVYMNRPQGAILDVYDVERIEVLRGPQGTLYGRNTIGGAVKYVTRRLDPDQSTLRTRITAGSYGQLDLVALGSLRVNDTFRLGGAVARLSRDGFGKNLQTGEGNYDKDVRSARFSAEWQPSDALFARFAYDYTDDDSTQRQGYRLRPTVSTAQRQLLTNRFDSVAGAPQLSPLAKSAFTAKGYSLQLEWTIDERWSMKSISAYREDEAKLPIDFDSTPAPSFDVPVIYINDQSSQEFQLLFDDGPLTALMGAYYLDASAFHAFDVRFNTVSQFTLGDVETKTWAAFGEVTWDFTDQLSLTVGGRYTSDERDSRVVRQTFAGPRSAYFGGTGANLTVPVVVGGVEVVPTFKGQRKDTAFTPRVILAWQPSTDLNLYASYSEGFKGGLFDPRGNYANPDIRRGVEPEVVESYEFGLKTQLLDGRATINTAVFFADYTDVQIPGSVVVTTPTGTTFVGTLTNAGAAEMKGVEFESMWRLTDGLSAMVSVGYIDAEYTEFIVNNTNVASQRDVQNTPDWTGSVGLTYGWQFGAGRLSMTGSAAYRGATQQFETRSPGLDDDAFWLLDAGINWASDDGKWKLGVHGRNLADEDYITSGYFFPGAATDDSVLAFYGNPRTYSATIEYRF
jgi:iron complex outermembrane receptor protein